VRLVGLNQRGQQKGRIAHLEACWSRGVKRDSEDVVEDKVGRVENIEQGLKEPYTEGMKLLLLLAKAEAGAMTRSAFLSRLPQREHP
jgi:hypothetical protein